MTAEAEPDPWVSQWFEDNPLRATPLEELTPEILELARGPVGLPPTRELANITDDSVDGIPIRIYRDSAAATGVIVYFHGGGFVMGSIGLMDHVARELTHATGAVVVSVGYRLAPEHPYPAGLDDCEKVTRWVAASASDLAAPADNIVVCGESAGGNLAAAVALRLRAAGDLKLAGQILIYPSLSGTTVYPSAEEFDGLVISRTASANFWAAYSAGRDLDDDPFAVPLSAAELAGLPRALVILGGRDLLRDEGRAYAARLHDAGVPVAEVCYPGQPHGFVNFEFPAAGLAFEQIGDWFGPAQTATRKARK